MKREAMKTVAEIGSMPISQLKGLVHREFVYDVLTQALATPAIVENVAAALNNFKEKVDQEMQLALKGEQSELTERLNSEADARSKAQTALKSGFRAMMGVADGQISSDAEKLLKLAHSYDLHAGANLDEQTDSVRSFLTDLKENYWAQVERVGMVELYNALEDKNELVCDLRTQCDWENADHVNGRMEEARKATDEAYRYFVRAVNAYAFVHGDDGYAGYIGYLNALILRYRRTHLHQTVAGPEAGSEAEETGTPEDTPSTPEETPSTPDTPDTPSEGETMHTVNWVNKDGETVKTMQVATGTKLTSSDYPKASSGYIWKPSWIGGGLTVNGDTTIREEPDDDLGV